MSVLDRIRPEIRALTAYAIEHESVPVKLDANELSFPLPEPVLEAFADLGRAVDLRRYPTGHAEPVTDLLADRLGVERSAVLAGNGSNEMISLVLSTFVGDGRARPAVVLALPSFGVYPIQAASHGHTVVTVPLDEDDFHLDAAAVLEAARRAGATLIILGSPNNPTGNRFDREAVESILAEFDGPVVIDEAYAPFAAGSWVGEWDRWPGLIVLRTLSKVGLAALRVGFLLASPALTAELRKAKLPFNLNSLSTHVACAALTHWDAMLDACAQVVAERERLARALAAQPGLRVFPSEANFLLMRAPGFAQQLWEGWMQRGVSVRSFVRKPGLVDCLRVTVGRPDENDRLLAALADVLAELPGGPNP